MRFLISFILLIHLNLYINAQSQNCVVLDVRGEVKIRPVNESEWAAVSEGRILENRETIRSGSLATARIAAFDGSIFQLSENAQIEPRELQHRDRNEIVMELTALELLKLPSQQKRPNLNQSAFVLHGTLPDSGSWGSKKELEIYLQLEKQGAMALYEQGFIAGFIIKWNRLASIFPEARSERAEAALIKAYAKMDMPYRMRKAIVAFKKHWPDSDLYVE